ncbi:formin-like protein 16 [Cryptomeria japonica]|uniref:formin-like protein 16 n=1 Tax=Cryptomeria japonica TaxID=3369 RepID=UPI0027D9E26E|nr:formin-like protein 16 [Cryptomeria japonica]
MDNYLLLGSLLKIFWKNATFAAESETNLPSTTIVAVLLPIFSTPRESMQMWLASRTTITPAVLQVEAPTNGPKSHAFATISASNPAKRCKKHRGDYFGSLSAASRPPPAPRLPLAAPATKPPAVGPPQPPQPPDHPIGSTAHQKPPPGSGGARNQLPNHRGATGAPPECRSLATRPPTGH